MFQRQQEINSESYCTDNLDSFNMFDTLELEETVDILNANCDAFDKLNHFDEESNEELQNENEVSNDELNEETREVPIISETKGKFVKSKIQKQFFTEILKEQKKNSWNVEFQNWIYCHLDDLQIAFDSIVANFINDDEISFVDFCRLCFVSKCIDNFSN